MRTDLTSFPPLPLLPPAVVVLYTQSRASQEWREVSRGILSQPRAAPGNHLPLYRPRADSWHLPCPPRSSSDGPR